MQKKNHCFHARSGTDRYRLFLLPLYPQYLQLQEIVKRLAVMHRNSTEQNSNVLQLLSTIENNFVNCWTVALEAVGVLANSFAPYPTENCNDEFSKTYRQLWSDTDAEFFNMTTARLKQTFQKSLAQLCQCAADSVDSFDNNAAQIDAVVCEHSTLLKSLFRETKILEAIDNRLKHSIISFIDIDDVEQSTRLMFPVSSSRLML